MHCMDLMLLAPGPHDCSILYICSISCRMHGVLHSAKAAPSSAEHSNIQHGAMAILCTCLCLSHKELLMQNELEDMRQFWGSISQEKRCALLTLQMEDLRAAARHVDATPGQYSQAKTSPLTQASCSQFCDLLVWCCYINHQNQCASRQKPCLTCHTCMLQLCSQLHVVLTFDWVLQCLGLGSSHL